MMKIAMLANVPATEFLSNHLIKSRYLGKEHPVPWVQLLCQALGEVRELAVSCITYSRAVRKVERITRNRVEYIFVPKRESGYLDPFHGYWPAFQRIKPLVDQINPDVVHAHGTEYCYGTVGSRLQYPLVLSVQGIMDKLGPYDERSRLKMALICHFEKKAVLSADAIIAKTGFVEEWSRSIGFQGVVEQIPNLVDPRFLGKKATLDSNRILCVGTLNKNKNQSLLLHAFALMPDRENYRLVFAGNGSWMGQLKELADKLGIHHLVEFKGRMSRQGVLEEMLKARVLVSCSFMETSPNVISEAQALGLSVIASDVGGNREMVNAGGLILPEFDPQLLSNMLSGLVKKEIFSEPPADIAHIDEDIVHKHILLYSEIKRP